MDHSDARCPGESAGIANDEVLEGVVEPVRGEDARAAEGERERVARLRWSGSREGGRKEFDES